MNIEPNYTVESHVSLEHYFTTIAMSRDIQWCIHQVMLWLKDLRVGQWIEPYIGLTQENSIESSVQDSLPYILKLHSPC